LAAEQGLEQSVLRRRADPPERRAKDSGGRATKKHKWGRQRSHRDPRWHDATAVSVEKATEQQCRSAFHPHCQRIEKRNPCRRSDACPHEVEGNEREIRESGAHERGCCRIDTKGSVESGPG
jgi:hypothetical protein